MPPDVPTGTMLTYAEAVPPEAIAEIQDPALRAQVEEHARQQVAAAAERAAAEGGGAVWCKMSTQSVTLTVEMMAPGKYICECGKQWTYKLLKPANGAITVPRHKPVKTDAPTPAPTPPTPPAPVAVATAPTPPVPVPAPIPPVPTPSVPAAAGEMTRMVEGMFGSATGSITTPAQPLVQPETIAAAEIARAIISALEPIARRGGR